LSHSLVVPFPALLVGFNVVVIELSVRSHFIQRFTKCLPTYLAIY